MKVRTRLELLTRAVAVVALGLSGIYPAIAQNYDPLLRGIGEVPAGSGVADRRRAEYDPVPIAIGTFDLLPGMEIYGGYDSNIRAENNDADQAALVIFSPTLSVSNGDAVNRINLNGQLENLAYLGRSNENQFNGNGDLRYERNVGSNGVVSGNVNAARDSIRRTDIDNVGASAEPVQYWRYRAGAGYRAKKGRIGFELTALAERRDYEDSLSVTGAPLDQDFRDTTRYTGTGTLSYSLTPDVGLLLSIVLNQREFDARTDINEVAGIPDGSYARSSNGYRIEGGLNFSAENRLHGSIRAGYQQQNYNSVIFSDISGLSFGAQILYNHTPLTTFRAGADRRVDDTSTLTIAGRRRTELLLGIDHALRSNLLVSADASYNINDFQAQDAVTEREADQYSAEFRLRYLANRKIRLNAAIGYIDRSGTLERDRFDKFTVLTGLEYRF